MENLHERDEWIREKRRYLDKFVDYVDGLSAVQGEPPLDLRGNTEQVDIVIMQTFTKDVSVRPPRLEAVVETLKKPRDEWGGLDHLIADYIGEHGYPQVEAIRDNPPSRADSEIWGRRCQKLLDAFPASGRSPEGVEQTPSPPDLSPLSLDKLLSTLPLSGEKRERWGGR